MESSMGSGWKVFDAEKPVLTCCYSFGPGIANALAVGTEKGLMVVSPPCRVAPSAFDELSRFGGVTALVASNAFHHLGLPGWNKRFPQAAIFAPAQSIARVEARSGLQGIRPLSEADTGAFTLTRSGPGLRFNGLALLIMGIDKRSLKAWLVRELEKQPPRWLIPAHGDIVDLTAGPEPLRRQLA